MSDFLTLSRQRERLLALQVSVDQELAAIEAAMRLWTRRPGRPRVPYTMTADEAVDMHDRYTNHGERGDDVLQGEREYKRRAARRYRRAVTA